ncbi:unnamed protein product [Zymoseptoria tritici ST99CH_3D7]|uniref:Zn(2)-C6 fungal-type domain-containing protein n=1 Tax=Zymoseptoria tritici (strain ST99CH_3D7) TaxID=1276538 RepID=A0A1X7S8H6_ZYMT9|nr:unnamed protein product [Zymoseptoria tritici ST99CH_3D7]
MRTAVHSMISETAGNGTHSTSSSQIHPPGASPPYPHGRPATPNSSKPHDVTSDQGVMYKIVPSPSGFTAVNGETPRYSSFRPDDSARHIPNASQVTTSESTPSANQATHNWRPQYQPPADVSRTSNNPPADNYNTNKRKREEAGAAESREQQPPQTDAPKTQCSRITPPPEKTSTRETAPRAYGREPSPVYRKDRGAPPPRAEPEISAALAESLQRSLEAADSSNRKEPSPERSASPEDSPPYDRQNSQTNEDVNSINLDGTKRRKRNFTHRTKTGCHTCRQRKKKCDETKPICLNCQRGTFECGGYGPKPPAGAKLSARQNTPIKPYEPSHGPTQYLYTQPPPAVNSTYEEPRRPIRPPFENIITPNNVDNYPRAPRSEPPRTHHYSHPSYPTEPRPPPSRDSYPPRSYPEPPPPPFAAKHGLPPPVDHVGLTPLQVYPPPAPPTHQPSPTASASWNPSHYRHPSHTSLPPQSHPLPGPPQHHQPPPPPPPSAPLSLPPPAPRSHYSSSLSSHSLTHRTTPTPRRGLTYLSNGTKTPQARLLTGEAVAYFIDDSLLRDRISCKRALESYNDACTARSMASPAEQSRLFGTILHPSARSGSGEIGSDGWNGGAAGGVGRMNGPQGSSGRRSVVLAPFRCELGYNIHLGDNVVVDNGCYFQDAAEIYLGNGVIVGADCKFYTLEDLSASSSGGNSGGGNTIGGTPGQEGPQGLFRAGAIRLEDHCVVGGNVTILPFRTIGKGARVVAGSVVTRDVRPGTVVAGNPAQEVRSEEKKGVEEENARMLEGMQSGFRGRGGGYGEV